MSATSATRTATHQPSVSSGGSFLIEDLLPEDVFTPEDLTPEQKQIAQTTRAFAEEQILPMVHEIEAKNFEVSRNLMRQAGELGLLGDGCAGAVWRPGDGQSYVGADCGQHCGLWAASR